MNDLEHSGTRYWHQQPHSGQRVVFIDQGTQFWPSGWMVWACMALGLTDFSLLAYIGFLAFKGH